MLAGAVCALVLAAAALPSQASAALLVDNGPGLPGAGGPDITRNISADDFQLVHSSTIRGGSFYYTVPGDFVSPSPMSYFIYSSTYKDEHQQPGALLGGGTLTITDIAPVPYSGGLPYATRYLANFTLETPFAAKGGDQYWFALTSESPTQILWTTSSWRSPSGTWNHHHTDRPGQWWRSDNERAFTLTGSIPEPATWAMMIVGFGAAGSALRARRHRIARPT